MGKINQQCLQAKNWLMLLVKFKKSVAKQHKPKNKW